MSHLGRSRRSWLGSRAALSAILAGAVAPACARGGTSPPTGGTPDAGEPGSIDADVDELDASIADASLLDARPPDARVGPDAGPTGGLGPWTGHDRLDPSQEPPFGVPRSQAPVFVTLGWDDNGYSGLEGTGGTGGMSWAVSLASGRSNADGSPVSFSFYFTSVYIGVWGAESPTYVKRSWRAARAAGHEIGNHTNTHQTSRTTTASGWQTEMDTCNTWLTKPFDAAEPTHSPDASKGIGATLGELYGFRTPYLDYNDATLVTVNGLDNVWYDTSIEEGFEEGHDASNFYWPYTLDTGSPGHDVQLGWEGTTKTPISPQPGLWEMPVYVVIVPPDDRCAEYGVQPGLRQRLQQRQSWFDTTEGKITGFDYNLWYSFQMTKAEFLATLKYSLDQRRRGNRAPFLFGVHTDYYSSKWTASVPASLADRQAAIAEFIDYARDKPEVRVVSAKQVLDWIRNPVPL